MMEGVAILATLVRGAEFAWDGRHLPEPLARVTQRPKGGMPLRVRLRQPVPTSRHRVLRLWACLARIVSLHRRDGGVPGSPRLRR
jgi:hypothetical protein